MSFSINRYGELACNMMAVEWCRRAYFFYSLWTDNDDVHYIYSPEDIASYEEDLAFSTWLLDVPVDNPSWERAMALRGLVPDLPRTKSQATKKDALFI